MTTLLLLISLFFSFVQGKDDGLALSPPLGWRSWNLYAADPHQDKIMRIMDGMVQRTRKDYLGNFVSLCDLGYCDVGLDDAWQQCNSFRAADGMHYHDTEGNSIVFLDRFPSLSNMTRHAMTLGLTAGWYANNCCCNDHCRNSTECDMQYQQDSKALVDYGFSSLKIDGCGNQNDLTQWDKYLTKFSDIPILVEHCKANDPSLGNGCPNYHFYRTSADIRNNYASIMSNLASVEEYRVTNSSYPGCWAYADMLQVGVRHGLNIQETRSHFGGWAIVSSPLILSHDVNDDEVMDRVWDIVSNREILAVNQAYVGESGGVYESASETTVLYSTYYDGEGTPLSIKVPTYQYLSKPIGGGKVAVLLMNSANNTKNLEANFNDIPLLDCQDEKGDCEYIVRDLWKHVTVGLFQNVYIVKVESHDAAFIMLEKARGVSKPRKEDFLIQ